MELKAERDIPLLYLNVYKASNEDFVRKVLKQEVIVSTVISSMRQLKNKSR